nr:MAG: major capsid protein [Microvirus sp.]
MNRNTTSRFDTNPTNLDISRSTFHRNSSVKTSFNVGDIIPFYVDEVLPGDTFNVNTSKVVRLQTLLAPVMDNIYLDTYYFFVPNRLVWEHWKQFNGENTASAWTQTVEYEVPQITAPASTGFAVGTIADYMGIPTGVPLLSVNALPFRAYALVCNEWFRDQNLQQPFNIPITDSTVVGVNTGNFVSDVAKGGLPFIASKYRDYFTSCLPAPQKGPDVSIALSGDLSVFGNGKSLGISDGTTSGGMYLTAAQSAPYFNGGAYDKTLGATPSAGTNLVQNKALGIVTTGESGLVADLSGASAISINALRMAFQMQKLYEKDARGGTRYVEIIKAHFGVTSPDARQQRPEYLGGNRLPININQVVQMAPDSTSPLGDTAAYSLTTDAHSDFTKSFTEHGFVLGLMVARYDHTYQQGLERFWSRKDRFDFYWPVFANIGEQAVKNKEIFATATSTDDEVFGYQEAWADYRYKPNRVSGEMRSTYATSLDVWHLGDKYASLPVLSDAWIREDKTNVNRCLAVQSTVSNQLFADLYVTNKTTRPMPMHSIPGLIDHH